MFNLDVKNVHSVIDVGIIKQVPSNLVKRVNLRFPYG
jgi:hypothetical protein